MEEDSCDMICCVSKSIGKECCYDCGRSLLIPGFMLIIEVVLAVILIVVFHMKTQPNDAVTIEGVEALFIVYMCFAILGMLYMYYKNRKSSGGKFAEFRDKVDSGTRYLTAGLYAFGSGSLFIDILYIFAYAHCMETRTHIAYHVFRVIFTLSQMLYLQKFCCSRLLRLCSLSFIVFHILATNISLWIYFVVEDAEIFPVDQSITDHRHKECEHKSNVTSLLEDWRENASPFTLEFFLTSSGLIYAIVKSMKSAFNSYKPSDYEEIASKAESSHTATTTNTSTTTSQTCSIVNTVRYPGFLAGLAVGVMIAVSSLVLKQKHDYNNSLVFHHSLMTVVFLSQVGCLIYLLYQLSDSERIRKSLSINDTLLILSYMGVLAWCLFFMFASASSIRGADSKIEASAARCIFVDNFFCFVQSTLQTWILTRTMRVRPHFKDARNASSEKKLNKIQQTCVYMIMTNIAFWVTDSFFEFKQTDVYYPVAYEFFKGNWKLFSSLCFPLNIFFRFHSAAVFFEITARFVEVAAEENAPSPEGLINTRDEPFDSLHSVPKGLTNTRDDEFKYHDAPDEPFDSRDVYGIHKLTSGYSKQDSKSEY
eukprot:gene3766-15049_t